MDHDFAVGFTFQRTTVIGQFLPQRTKVFDNSVMYQRDMIRCVRVSISCRGRAMRGPARMRDAHDTWCRIAGQFLHQIRQLTLGPAADQASVVYRADAGTVITAIFHPFQTIDQTV